VIIPLIIILGWAAYFLSVMIHFEEMHELVEATENPGQGLLDQAYSDGGRLVFAALFGWLVAPAYAAPWWLLFLAATWLRSMIALSAERSPGHRRRAIGGRGSCARPDTAIR